MSPLPWRTYMDDANEKEQIVQEYFKKTNIKLTEDDPLVEAIIAFRNVISETKEDFVVWATVFASQFQDQLEYTALRNNTKIEILEHELKDTSKEVCEELKTIVNFTLTKFDEKTKDLNMVLTKLQADYDRDSNERFDKYFSKIDERYHQMLALQKKNNACSQRELLFGFVGLVVGVMACLLVFFVLSSVTT